MNEKDISSKISVKEVVVGRKEFRTIFDENKGGSDLKMNFGEKGKVTFQIKKGDSITRYVCKT